MRKVYKFVILLFAVTIIGCDDNDEVDPSVKTLSVTASSASSFLAKGSIDVIGSAKVKDYGFEYFFDFNNPVRVSLGNSPVTGPFEQEVSPGLYYGANGLNVRAYLENEIGVVYGETKQVTFPILSVYSVVPLAAREGDHVTITGANFSTTKDDNIVLFGEVQAKIISATTSQLVVEVPGKNDSYYYTISVTVRLGNQQVQGASNFQYLPSVTSFSPQSGGVGTYVTITGSNFSSGSYNYSVVVDNISAYVSAVTSSSIGFYIPSGITKENVKIKLVVSGTSFELPGEFTIPAPAITSFNPKVGITGSMITLSGNNLTNDTGNDSYNNSLKIKVGGVVASVQSISSTEIKFYIPQGLTTGTYALTMETPVRTLNLDDQFILSSPTITSFSPTSGVTNSFVTIKGENLGSTYYSSTVSMGSVQVSIYSWTENSITLYVPPSYYISNGSYKFTINTGGQSVTSTNSFTVTD